MRRVRVLQTGAAALAAIAVSGTGALVALGQAPAPDQRPSGALSSVSLTELPVRLTHSKEIRPTGHLRTFDLTSERAPWEIAPGVTVQAVTYNGTVPGPTLRVTEGHTVRVTLKNDLDQDTTIHCMACTSRVRWTVYLASRSRQ
jgi:manganese oxidase